jgi:hypothetical protein
MQPRKPRMHLPIAGPEHHWYHSKATCSVAFEKLRHLNVLQRFRAEEVSGKEQKGDVGLFERCIDLLPGLIARTDAILRPNVDPSEALQRSKMSQQLIGQVGVLRGSAVADEEAKGAIGLVLHGAFRDGRAPFGFVGLEGYDLDGSGSTRVRRASGDAAVAHEQGRADRPIARRPIALTGANR